MIITQTPLRISFAGGGSDIKDYYQKDFGSVISTAIDKYVYVIVKERYDNDIYVSYSSRNEVVSCVDDIQHDIVRECLKLVGIESGIEIKSLADIPASGSGLGSSSSFTVGLLNALFNYVNNPQTPKVLAELACQIEIDILKKPIGKQDQYIASYGGLKKFVFNRDESVSVEQVKLTDEQLRRFGSQILLFFTNTTRKADNILKDQKKETVNKRMTLSQMVEQVEQVKEKLEQDNFDMIGLILNNGWNLKKQMTAKISNDSINDMYKLALDGGAIGGKICGAGGGGFLMTYCQREKQNNLREKLKEFKEMPFLLEKSGSKVIFNVERYTWK